LQRLEEDTWRLQLSYNIQRQEEITEEIEVILLSADMLPSAASFSA
jgi:F0F1-type ATP synthase gamma subunit